MRQRNYQDARYSYDTVLQLMQNLTPGDTQNEAIQKKLILLRTWLEAVGQKY
jgi:hypothetical protein